MLIGHAHLRISHSVATIILALATFNASVADADEEILPLRLNEAGSSVEYRQMGYDRVAPAGPDSVDTGQTDFSQADSSLTPFPPRTEPLSGVDSNRGSVFPRPDSTKLPPPSFQRLADKMTSVTGREPSWILTRLGIAVSMFVGLVWVQRLFGPTTSGISTGAVHVCGKVRLDAKQSLHLVRIGQRLLVLLESPQGMQRLAEITDPDEVERVLTPTSRRFARANDQRGPTEPKQKQIGEPPRQVARTASELLSQISEYENA